VDLPPSVPPESDALLTVVRLTRGMMSAARERSICVITRDLTMKKFSLNEPTSEYQLYNLRNVPQANNSRPALCAHMPIVQVLRDCESCMRQQVSKVFMHQEGVNSG